MGIEQDRPGGACRGASAPGRAADSAASSGEWFFDDLDALGEGPLPAIDAAASDVSRRRHSLRALWRRRANTAVAAKAVPPRGRRLEQRLLVVLTVAVVLALALAAAVVAKLGADRQQAAGDARSFESSLESASPLVVVVGDRDLVEGRGVRAAQRWPALVQNGVGGEVIQLGAPGMGYLARKGSGTTFEDEAARIPRAADVILIVSGTTDAGARRLPILRAATAAYSAAAARAPRAKIAVIGPPLVAHSREPELTALRGSLRLASETAGVRWVDPLAQRWFGLRGESPASASGLTESDQQIMADRVVALLRRIKA